VLISATLENKGVYAVGGAFLNGQTKRGANWNANPGGGFSDKADFFKSRFVVGSHYSFRENRSDKTRSFQSVRSD